MDAVKIQTNQQLDIIPMSVIPVISAFHNHHLHLPDFSKTYFRLIPSELTEELICTKKDKSSLIVHHVKNYLIALPKFNCQCQNSIKTNDKCNSVHCILQIHAFFYVFMYAIYYNV